MAASGGASEALKRLRLVQARVRTLAGKHFWFRDAIRDAFAGYLDLGERFQREKSAMQDRKRQLARELLTEGWLFDPKARDNSPCLLVRVEGLCPVVLAKRLEKHRSGDVMPRNLEREGAAAALAALDRDAVYQDRDLPEKKRETMASEYRAAQAAKTHVSFSWMIVVSRPEGWEEPADPRSLDLLPLLPEPGRTGNSAKDLRAYAAKRFASGSDEAETLRSQLGRFSPEDYLTIAFYRLGGLADAVRLNPADFPAEVAEQMLSAVEHFVDGVETKRSESLAATVPTVPPGVLVRRPSAAAAVDRGAIALALPVDADESASPALTANQSRVLQAMARFDASRLLSAAAISAEMDLAERVSERTIGPILRTFIELRLAERPAGSRSGARLLLAGRRLAAKIAD